VLELIKKIMQISLKEFSELTVNQLFEIYKLRNEVFIVEQNCVYQDVDDKDLKSKHLLITIENILVAYARIIPPGISYKEPGIGRVVVKKEFRGNNYAKILMKSCLSNMFELFKNQDIMLSAQTYLIKFYSDLGFNIEGNEYLEDNIPHIKMRFKIM
jgi:ElaA protein